MREQLAETKRDAAHDVGHAIRVAENGLAIADQMGAIADKRGFGPGGVDREALVAACLLHDAVHLPKDAPDRHAASRLSAERAGLMMLDLDYPGAVAAGVARAVLDHSYSRGAVPTTDLGRIVQDADRLDALGAVGILRVATTGAALGSQYYDPDDPWARTRDHDERHYVIDHFFTKLLKLPARMNTAPGRAEADRRVRFMVQFLGRLGDELGDAFDVDQWDLLSPAAGESEAVLPAEIPMPA